MMRSPLTLVALLLSAASASAETPVGAVDRCHLSCTAIAADAVRDLAAGAQVHAGEEIATGAGVRLQFTLDDGTTVTLGENATVTVDEFVNDPGRASTFRATVAGAFRYVSGALAPEARTATVTTPFAVIGIRGTDFWGGPIDGTFGVLLFEGAIVVTAGGVSVPLEAVRSGVDLAVAGEAPGAATAWGQEKIDRAIATVTFP